MAIKATPITKGIAGAVVGAGLAVAATKILKNKKVMKKVRKTVTDAKSGMTDTAKRLQTKVVKGGKSQIKKITAKRISKTK